MPEQGRDTREREYMSLRYKCETRRKVKIREQTELGTVGNDFAE
jgi:hypothetical protein